MKYTREIIEENGKKILKIKPKENVNNKKSKEKSVKKDKKQNRN